MPKKITKREALTKCIELWTWLSKNSEKDKVDYYKENPNQDVYCMNCPVCEYMMEHKVKGKSHHCNSDCIINWGTKEGGCCRPDSPYVRWDDSWNWQKQYSVNELTLRTKYALEIVELAKQALAKLPKKN